MTLSASNYLGLSNGNKQYSLFQERRHLPIDVRIPFDPYKEAIVVELSNLNENLYEKVAKYDTNKDGVLSNDENNKELDEVYKKMGLDLKNYATKEITSTEISTEMVFEEREQWHSGELSYGRKYCTVKVRTDRFEDGSTRETYMTENAENPVTNPRMTTEDNAVYNGEKGFSKTIYYKEDGTIIEHYVRGNYYYNEEYDSQDPHSLSKTDNYKEVLVITYSNGEKKTIENNAKNLREDYYFHDRIPETMSLEDYVWKYGQYCDNY